MAERDVEFRLTVVRDPAAKRNISTWEKDLIKADETYQRGRVANARKAERDMNRLRGMQVQAEKRALAEQEKLGRESLQRRLQEYKRHTKAVADARDAIDRRLNRAYGGGPTGAGRGGGSGIGGVAVGAGLGRVGLGAVARFGGPLAVAAGIGSLARSGSRKEDELASLQGITGSAEKAKALRAEFQSLALATGVSTEAMSTMLTTLRGFNIPMDEAKKKISELTVLSRGSTDRMQRLGLAYAQAASQGRFMSEELNQMIDAGFNPLISISTKTGKSIRELRKEMEEGTFQMSLLSDAFTAASGSGSQAMAGLEAKAKTTSAAWAALGLQITATAERYSEILGLNAAAGAIANAGSTALNAVTPGTGSQGVVIGEAETAAVAAKRMALRAGLSEDQLRALNAQSIAHDNSQYGRIAKKSEMGFTGKNNLVADMQVQAQTLDMIIAKGHERREQAAAKAAAEEKRAREERERAIKAGLMANARELTNIREINKLRKEGMDKQLEAQQKSLSLAQKATKEARDSLLSARERFGAMSTEEQQAAISTVVKARKGVNNLSLDEINTLQTLGTKESSRLASQALQYRAGAAFGEDPYRKRVEGIDEQRRRIKARMASINDDAVYDYDAHGFHGQVAVTTGAKRFSRAQSLEIARLRERDEQLQQQRAQVYQRVGQRESLRNSLFAGERGDLRQAAMAETRVQANVKQTVEFVAKYDHNAQHIANQVIKLYNEANKNHVDEVLKLLEPVREQVRQLQRRQNALSGIR